MLPLLPIETTAEVEHVIQSEEHTGHESKSPAFLRGIPAEAVGLTWKAGRFWFGLAVGVGTGYLALRSIDFERARQALGQVDPLWATLAALSVIITVTAKAARWQLLYPRTRARLPLSALTPALLVGMMVNLLVPARLGELARVYALGQLTGESKALSLGTIAVEKWADLVALLALLAGLLFFVPWPDWLVAWARGLFWITLMLTGVLISARFFFERIRPLVERGADRLPLRWQRWLQRGWQAAETGVTALYGVPGMGRLFGWTLIIWLLAASTNWLMLRALALPATPVIALTLLVLLQAGSALPSSPAKIGVFHYLAIVGLELFSVPRETALAFAVWLHLIVVGLLILLGLASMLWVSSHGHWGEDHRMLDDDQHRGSSL